MILLIISATSLVFVGLNYLAYFFLVLRNKHVKEYLRSVQTIGSEDVDPHGVCVVVSAYNESVVIRKKLENLAALDYPSDKLNVLVVDDGSEDETAEIAERAIKDLQLRGRVIRNPERKGLNASLNVAFRNVIDPLICVTDADVLLAPDSLKKSVNILGRMEDAGGVTGRLFPISEMKNFTTQLEENYRVFYDQAMLAESSLHSAFPGNGTLIVFKKSSVSHIPERFGSSDGNIAIGVIKSGYRFLYAPNAVVKEIVPETLSQQRLQKVRRARRLIEVMVHNLDILFNKQNGSFGRRLYPLKFAMYILSPVLLLLGFASGILYLFTIQNIIVYFVSTTVLTALISAFVAFSRARSLLSSFVMHNLYLLLGLLSLPKRNHLWRIVERKTL